MIIELNNGVELEVKDGATHEDISAIVNDYMSTQQNQSSTQQPTPQPAPQSLDNIPSVTIRPQAAQQPAPLSAQSTQNTAERASIIPRGIARIADAPRRFGKRFAQGMVENTVGTGEMLAAAGHAIAPSLVASPEEVRSFGERFAVPTEQEKQEMSALERFGLGAGSGLMTGANVIASGAGIGALGAKLSAATRVGEGASVLARLGSSIGGKVGSGMTKLGTILSDAAGANLAAGAVGGGVTETTGSPMAGMVAGAATAFAPLGIKAALGGAVAVGAASKIGDTMQEATGSPVVGALATLGALAAPATAGTAAKKTGSAIKRLAGMVTPQPVKKVGQRVAEASTSAVSRGRAALIGLVNPQKAAVEDAKNIVQAAASAKNMTASEWLEATAQDMAETGAPFSLSGGVGVGATAKDVASFSPESIATAVNAVRQADDAISQDLLKDITDAVGSSGDFNKTLAQRVLRQIDEAGANSIVGQEVVAETTPDVVASPRTLSGLKREEKIEKKSLKSAERTTAKAEKELIKQNALENDIDYIVRRNLAAKNKTSMRRTRDEVEFDRQNSQNPNGIVKAIIAKGGIDPRDRAAGDLRAILDKRNIPPGLFVKPKYSKMGKVKGFSFDDMTTFLSEDGLVGTSAFDKNGNGRATINDVLDRIADEQTAAYKQRLGNRDEAIYRTEEMLSREGIDSSKWMSKEEALRELYDNEIGLSEEVLARKRQLRDELMRKQVTYEDLTDPVRTEPAIDAVPPLNEGESLGDALAPPTLNRPKNNDFQYDPMQRGVEEELVDLQGQPFTINQVLNLNEDEELKDMLGKEFSRKGFWDYFKMRDAQTTRRITPEDVFGEGFKLGKNGVINIPKNIPFKALHNVKVALDNEVTAALRKGENARDLIAFRNVFNNKLKKMSPEYARWMSESHSQRSLMEAADFGASLAQPQRERLSETILKISEMNPIHKSAALNGWMKGVIDRLGAVSDTANLAAKILNTPNERKILKALAPNADVDALARKLARKAEVARDARLLTSRLTGRNVLSGSGGGMTTAASLVQDMTENPLRVATGAQERNQELMKFLFDSTPEDVRGFAKQFEPVEKPVKTKRKLTRSAAPQAIASTSRMNKDKE